MGINLRGVHFGLMISLIALGVTVHHQMTKLRDHDPRVVGFDGENKKWVLLMKLGTDDKEHAAQNTRHNCDKKEGEYRCS